MTDAGMPQSTSVLCNGLLRHIIDHSREAILVVDMQRMELVDEFNEDCLLHRPESDIGRLPILILSLKTGGSGLNLIGADRVIHFDRWWNPAVENQATDRVHRIGQKNSVSSYKLITLNTIEEKKDARIIVFLPYFW